VTTDEQDKGGEAWATPLEAFGAYLRTQRRLANLSLREMAQRTNLSNAYISQIERGLHAPSVRVLRAVAKGLDLSAEAMLMQAGLFDDDLPPEAEPDHAEAEADAGEASDSRPDESSGSGRTESAIRHDPRITGEQKEALLSVYRSYLAANGHA